MFWINLTTQDGSEPKINVRRGSLDVQRVKVVRMDLPDAVEARITIPLEVLGGVQPESGRAIGFDLECEAWNVEDRRILHTIWSALRWSVHTGRAGTLFFGR
jgi:hypothetical protein